MTRVAAGDPYESGPNAASSNREYASPSSSVNPRMISRSVSSVRISEVASGQRRERFVVLRADDAFLLVLEVVFLVGFAFGPRLALDSSFGFTCSGSFLYPAPRFHRS